ncbi:MAG: PQQ-dependent sugar dehydrogenase [Bacteroidota bacterium]
MYVKNLLLYLLGGAVIFLTHCQPKSSAPIEEAPSLTEVQFTQYCSGCHGAQMQAFVDREWKHGKTKDSIVLSIKSGFADAGMPAFDSTFSDQEVANLADYILTGLEKAAIYDFDEAPSSNIFPTEAGFSLQLDTIATGMKSVWGMAFLPDGSMLINDKSGEIYRHSEDAPMQKVSGVPEVRYKGQGGLLDIELHPDFAANSWVYISYSKPMNDTLATTAIHRAKLEGNALLEGKDIFIAAPYSTRRHHFGSRLEFDKEGYLFFSVGDRGARDKNPQNLDSHCGKIHRIKDDGGIPEDNPFVDTDGAMPSIWSYGHRNPQGLAMHPITGEIWDNEHGPRGGDEINQVQKGLNYGWPVISYGINYDGTTFTTLTEKEGMEQPIHYWVPSIGVCGMTFIKGDKYPGWENQILSGSLRFKYLNRTKIEAGKLVEEEILLKNVGRLRSVEMGPDGYIYVGVESPGSIFRLVPTNENMETSVAGT